eukprot:scaffold3573_cov153-Skeletonema_menzelii.AAC.2
MLMIASSSSRSAYVHPIQPSDVYWRFRFSYHMVVCCLRMQARELLAARLLAGREAGRRRQFQSVRVPT